MNITNIMLQVFYYQWHGGTTPKTSVVVLFILFLIPPHQLPNNDLLVSFTANAIAKGSIVKTVVVSNTKS